MLSTRKSVLDSRDKCIKQESLDNLKTAKSESAIPSLNDYRKVSSTIEKIHVNTPIEIKVEPSEVDTKLSLINSLDKEAGDVYELKANENHPKLNSYSKTTPQKQGEQCARVSCHLY